MNRRDFVRALGAGSAAAAGLASGASRASALFLPSAAGFAPPPPCSPAPYGPLSRGGAPTLVVLHTNDTHSRLDPFPMDGGPFAGRGGAARRATLVRRIRDANEHVLLLDAGDIFQGTPYFNFFDGEPEFRVMTEMGYDAATLGNHDFDNGVDGLVSMLPHAGFDFVCANYDIRNPALAERVAPSVVREFDGVKVGIFGLGIAFRRLVLPALHEGVRYRDPVAAARSTARELRGSGCAFVICLSHLGYAYDDPRRPSDRTVAAAVPEIDLILGGHTHTFMEEAESFDHGQADFTLVNQVGWGGMRLGRIDVAFGDGGRASGWEAAGYDLDNRYDR